MPNDSARSPTLLFNADELPRIRRTLQRPEFTRFRASLSEADRAADTRFLREEIKLNDPAQDLGRACNILSRCACLHLLDECEADAELARLALDRILAYKRWDWILEGGTDTVGIMRNGMTIVAVTLALDWLGDRIGAGQRAAVDDYILREAGPAAQRGVFGMTHHDQVKGWTMDPDGIGFHRVDVSRWPVIFDRINLRIIATSGLAAAGAFLHGRHPAAAQWAEEAQASLRLFASREQPDATFPEGVSYWSFTYTYYIVSLEFLRRNCGQDDRGVLDFPAMARYVQCATVLARGKTPDCINVSDANACAGPEALSWIGRHFRDTTANYLVGLPGVVAEHPNSMWAAIWYDETVPARRAADTALDRIMHPGVIVSRSGWELADAVLSFRTGGPENHEHADRNSLLFFLNGERLINDPLKANYSPTDPKWLLRLPDAHSAVLIDGQGHVYHHGEEGTNASTARAVLQDYRTGRDWMLAVSDATDAYRRAGLPATSVQRTVVYLKPDIIIVLDRVRLTEARPVQVRFQVHNDDGHGTATTIADGFAITRPQATLQAGVTGLPAGTVRIDQLPLPAEGGVYPFAEIASPAATAHEILTFCTAAPAGTAHGRLAAQRTPDGWRVTGEHRGRQVALTLVTATDIPIITL
jgi:hypothetical protein